MKLSGWAEYAGLFPEDRGSAEEAVQPVRNYAVQPPGKRLCAGLHPVRRENHTMDRAIPIARASDSWTRLRDGVVHGFDVRLEVPGEHARELASFPIERVLVPPGVAGNQ